MIGRKHTGTIQGSRERLFNLLGVSQILTGPKALFTHRKATVGYINHQSLAALLLNTSTTGIPQYISGVCDSI